MTRTLLLFGAGPGIGTHIASTFASQGGIEHVVLLGRNKDRLTNDDLPFVQKAAPSVKVSIVRADLSDLDAVPKVLEEVDTLTKGEDVEVVYYNAARIQPTGAALDVGVGEIEEDLRVLPPPLHSSPIITANDNPTDPSPIPPPNNPTLPPPPHHPRLQIRQILQTRPPSNLLPPPLGPHPAAPLPLPRQSRPAHPNPRLEPRVHRAGRALRTHQRAGACGSEEQGAESKGDRGASVGLLAKGCGRGCGGEFGGGVGGERGMDGRGWLGY